MTIRTDARVEGMEPPFVRECWCDGVFSPHEHRPGKCPGRSLVEAARADAEKWRDRAADDGGIDRKAEETLGLIAEINRLRVVVAAFGGIICPRCEGQQHDVGACGLCQNVGWLDENAGVINV